MDTWKKNRWLIFTIIGWVYLILELSTIFLRLSGLIGLLGFYRALVWPEAVLGMLVIFSLAQIMQYFLEWPRLVAGVYIYAVTNCLLVTIAVRLFPRAAVGLISLLPLLYFIICLFRVRASEVRILFKWIGALEILNIGVNFLFGFLFMPYGRYVELLHSLERLSPFVLILILLTRMQHFEMEYRTALEKDIDSIGKT